jgi:hypothetical protein
MAQYLLLAPQLAGVPLCLKPSMVVAARLKWMGLKWMGLLGG